MDLSYGVSVVEDLEVWQRSQTLAIGSSSELRTQTYIAADLNVISSESATKIIDETKRLNRMLRALTRAQYQKLEA